MAKPDTDASEDDAPWWRSLLRPAAMILACLVAVVLFVVTMTALKAQHAGYWTMMGATVVYGVAILSIIFGAARFRRRSCTPAKRRYEDRIMAAMSVYVVALIAAIGAFQRLHPSGILAWALAIAPALPVVATIAFMGLYLKEETDEFERTVTVQGSLWAMGGILALATLWGFLELFGLVPHLQVWWAFPVWAAIFGPAQFIVRRRYR